MKRHVDRLGYIRPIIYKFLKIVHLLVRPFKRKCVVLVTIVVCSNY
jgi:hypothetical protein